MAITPSSAVLVTTETTERNSALSLMGKKVTIPALAAPITTVESNAPFCQFALDRISFRQLIVFLNIPAPASGGATDTLDVFIDTSPDGGTTWINLIHFTQVLANGGAKKFTAATPYGSASGSADVSADLAAAATPRSAFGDTYRVRVTTVNGGGGAFSFNPSLQLFFLP